MDKVGHIFSLNGSNGVSKHSSFYTDFKNVQLTLLKSAPIENFALKIDFSGTTFSSAKQFFG
jgi:hypothetical protein